MHPSDGDHGDWTLEIKIHPYGVLGTVKEHRIQTCLMHYMKDPNTKSIVEALKCFEVKRKLLFFIF